MGSTRDVGVIGLVHRDHPGVAGPYLLDVPDHAIVRGVAWSERDHRNPVIHEGDGSMLHLPGRVAIGVNVRDLLQLESPFEGDRVVEAPTQVQHGLGPYQPAGQRERALAGRERILHQPRDLHQILEPLSAVDLRQVAAAPPERHRQQIARGEGGTERLARRDTDLRSGVRIEHTR
jgi:hypothetical protein